MSELLPVETELWERDMNFAYDKGKADGIDIGIDICLALFRGWQQTRLATNIAEFEDTLEKLKEQKNEYMH